MKRSLEALIVTLLCLFSMTQCDAQYLDQNVFVPNGPVNSIATYGNQVFLGGAFNDMGKASGSFVELDSLSGVLNAFLPKVNGVVYAIIEDGDGGWYIGGRFSHVANVPVPNLAHIIAPGLLDTVFRPDADGPVYALCLTNGSGEALFAGGEFYFIGGQTRRNTAKLNKVTGLADGWAPNPDGPVYALAAEQNSNVLYVGGSYSQIGGYGRTNLSRISTETGTILSPNYPYLDFNYIMNGPVRSIAITGNFVIAGGDFQLANSTFRPFIAFFFISGVLSPEFVNLNYRVRTIVPRGNLIYLGGDFTTINSVPRNRVAAYDTLSNSVTAFNPDANAQVYTLCVRTGEVIIGGNFSFLGNSPRKCLGRVDTITGVVDAWDPHASNTVYAIGMSNGKVYCGGEMVCMNGLSRTNLASIDTATGNVTAWDPDVDGEVNVLLVRNDTLFVGGSFVSMASQPRKGLASFDLNTLQVHAFDPSVDGSVKTLLAAGRYLYVGGNFFTAGNLSRSNLAQVDLTNGLVTGWNCPVNGTINTMAFRGSDLYIGGFFTTVRGINRYRLAAIDTGTAFPTTGWIVNSDDGVYSLVSYQNDILAGGWFTSLNSTARSNFGKTDTQGNLSSFDPSPNAFVRTMFLSGDTLLIGGGFTSFNNQAQSHFTAYDLSTGVPLSFNTSFDNTLRAIIYSNGVLYSGGEFNYSDNIYHPFFSRHTSSQVLGSGENITGENEPAVFPNPCRDLLSISIPQLRVFYYQVYGLQGKLLMSGQYIANGSALDVSMLPEGAYLIRLSSGLWNSSKVFLKVE